MTDTKPPATTTDSGIPAASDEFSLTVGPRGPTVLHDHYLVQKIQHFKRERVPERVMHAKGSGAHGFFEVTNDVTWFTKATFWSATTHRYSSSGTQPSSRTSSTPRSACRTLASAPTICNGTFGHSHPRAPTR
jgi:catalase